MNLIVFAKAPVAGRCKTRLCPPCTPLQAASIAEAALADTLDTAMRSKAGRPVLVLDGDPGAWIPSRFDVVPQRGGGLDERLAAASEDVGGPALLVGMDTPQLTAPLLRWIGRLLIREGIDAVLGEAVDGGWWSIGLREPDPQTFLGVPMSTASTWRMQLWRLRSLGLSVAGLPLLRDVDRFEDALQAAAEAPASRFAFAVDRVSMRAVGTGASAVTRRRPVASVAAR